MITRDLLVDAAEVCVKRGYGTQELIQRQVRVGFVTAAQLLITLTDLGILDEGRDGKRRSRRARAGRPALETEIDAAITDGFVNLTPSTTKED